MSSVCFGNSGPARTLPPVRPAKDARSRDKILYELKTLGPLTAQALAERLGVTAMAVRQQLYKLRDQGTVEFSDEAGGVGRPKRIWELAEAGQREFPDNHAELALGMIEAVKRAFGEDGLERLVQARTEAQAVAYARRIPAGEPLARRVAALARIRREEGYMAEWKREPDGTLLLAENHCPICAAAQACVGLCAGELELFRTVLGPGVGVEREEYLLEGARRCVYRIDPRAS